MLLAADLAGYVHVCLIWIEPGTEPVVLNSKYICALRRNIVQKLYQTAGLIKQCNGKSQTAVSHNKTLRNDTLYEADVNIAAGEQACDLFAPDVDLALQNRRDRSCA